MRSLLASKLPPSFTPAFATKAGSISFPPTLRPIAVIAGVGALAAGAVYAHATLAGAAVRLRSLDVAPTALACAALLLALASSAFAWRCALRSAGGEIRFGTACGCYGLGSLANAVLPARLGDAIRVGLFARHVEHSHRGRLSACACLAVAGSRAVVYLLLCSAGAAAGLLPGWLLLAPLAVAVPLVYRRRLAGLGLAPAVFGWATVSAAGRLAGGAAVLYALDVANPVGSAFVGLTALAAAGVLPIAPGAVGVAGAGMAIALEQSGVAAPTAVAAAVAFHALETLASVAFGTGGWLALRFAPGGAEARRALRRGRDGAVPAGLPAASSAVPNLIASGGE